MTWRTIKIWEFLTERKDRMTPDEANISGISRLEKIDFSGTIHVKEWKNTNTWMIAVYPWDLVISGINVEKGALAVYEWKEKILATIHYSSYEYNPGIIDIEYLRYFTKCSTFRKIILEQAWWGIKTEIKAKKFLSLQILLPDINTQRSIVSTIQWLENELKQVDAINEKNIKLSKSLKSSILKDAIQWKLVPQDPTDESASILIGKIQIEKAKLIAEWRLKKQKSLPLIIQEEIPYELPKGWEWVRLGNVWILKRGKSKHRPRNDSRLFDWWIYPFIQTWDVSSAKRTNWIIHTINWYYNDFWLSQSELHEKGTLCVTIAANIAECGFLWFDSCLPDSIVCFDLISEELKKYTYFFIQNSKQYLEDFAPQTAQKNINLEILQHLPFPLPPAKELANIVSKVDELIELGELLNKQVIQAKERSEKLVDSVLQGVFNW
jgi:type I restriction enzyme, S subunit